ncbi:hypothetical protein JCM11491_006043 [Sporobolomyces phaffii]
MPLGHERINAREQDPNDHITFIRAIETYADHAQALHLLKCLAAQFKPVMKAWGFAINSLVEYEPNPVFAGRNWNAGEVVEIVLRRKSDGTFLPWQFLLYVMCHECSHIKVTLPGGSHHSWAFQSVNKQLRQAIAGLRAKGYTGDGFYSHGRTLVPEYAGNDSTLPTGEGPTYTCGGALKKRRKRRARTDVGRDDADAAARPRRRERGSAVPLGTTGRQTAVAKKAGARVTGKNKFQGQGRTLGAAADGDASGNHDDDDDKGGQVASFKGLRAGSNVARSARATAALERLERENRAKQARELEQREEPPEPEGDEWEFEDEDDEDKAEIARVEQRFGTREKDYLRDEMRDWDHHGDDDDDDDDDDDANDDRGGGGEGVELTDKDKALIERLEQKRKFRATLAQSGSGANDDDDDVIIVEPAPEASTSNGRSPKNKKAKVCLCKMPERFLAGAGERQMKGPSSGGPPESPPFADSVTH